MKKKLKYQGGGMAGMMGGVGGMNPASMIIQGITGAIGGINSTLNADKQRLEQQKNISLQNAYQKQEVDNLKALELDQLQNQNYQYGGELKKFIKKFSPGGTALNSYNTLYNTGLNLDNNFQTPFNYQNPQILQQQNDDGKYNIPIYTEYNNPSKFKTFMNKNGETINSIGTTMSTLSQTNGDIRKPAWQDAKSAIAKSNPIFGMFNGIDEGLQGLGKIIGGDKGQKGVQFFTDPIGFILNLGSGIKEREEKKRELQLEYDNRNNIPIVQQPSHFGTYMAKYGANPRNLEQRVIDDIYSDFDKFMKLK